MKKIALLAAILLPLSAFSQYEYKYEYKDVFEMEAEHLKDYVCVEAFPKGSEPTPKNLLSEYSDIGKSIYETPNFNITFSYISEGNAVIGLKMKIFNTGNENLEIVLKDALLDNKSVQEHINIFPQMKHTIYPKEIYFLSIYPANIEDGLYRREEDESKLLNLYLPVSYGSEKEYHNISILLRNLRKDEINYIINNIKDLYNISYKIEKGMTKTQVIALMGEPEPSEGDDFSYKFVTIEFDEDGLVKKVKRKMR